MILVLLSGIVLAQDDISAWIVQLGSESFAVREEATRKLNALGLEAVGPLEKARDEAKSPERRARIENLVGHIRKMADLAKVFGPTRRVTIASRGKLLKEVLAPLKAPFVSAIDTGDLDEEARIDVQVREGTWWEAVDRVVHAAGARYRLVDEENGRVRISLIRGKEREWPVVYANQFRISVKEATRVESRALGEAGEWAVLFVELRYQPDLKPHSGWTHDSLQVLSIVDAKGVNVKDDRPEWAAYHPLYGGGPFTLLSESWVRPKAVMPLVVSGTTHVEFPSRTKAVELDLEGGKRKTRVGPATLHVVKTEWEKDESRVQIRAEAEGMEDLAERLFDREVVLIDSEGRRHPGRIVGRSRLIRESAAEWSVVFTGGIKPRKLLLSWIEELHPVEIPFRLEGVRLPDLTSK